MAGDALQGLGGVDELLNPLVPVVHVLQRLGEPQGLVQGDVQGPGTAGDLLGDHIHLGVGHVQHPPHIPDGAPGGHGAEGDDLGHPVVAVLPADIVHHLVSAGVAEIHVDIRHAYPLRIQKTLEVQPVLHGLHVGDVQAVGHHAPCGGASARPHGDMGVFGEADKVGDNQEVVGKAHPLDHVQLIVQLLVEIGMPPLVLGGEALLAQAADVGLSRFSLWHGEFRQVVFAEGELQIAQSGDLLRVGYGVRVTTE